jgi:hypothetical protein
MDERASGPARSVLHDCAAVNGGGWDRTSDLPRVKRGKDRSVRVTGRQTAALHASLLRDGARIVSDDHCDLTQPLTRLRT